MNIAVLILLLLFQTSPSLEQKLLEEVILEFIESREAYNSDRKYYISETLDSVNVRIYQKVLDPQNAFVYESLTLDQKELIQDLLKLRNPSSLDINDLVKQEKFKIRPLEEKDYNDWLASSIKVSRVAFSPNGNEACFILEYLCGSKCGVGVLIFAQKENESWKIKIRKRLWIA